MAALKMYHQEIRLLSKEEVSDRRRDLLKDLNGNAFFSLKLWPRDMQAVFWKKPMGVILCDNHLHIHLHPGI